SGSIKQYSTSASGVGKGYSHGWCFGRSHEPLLLSHEYYIAFIKQFHSQPINHLNTKLLIKKCLFRHCFSATKKIVPLSTSFGIIRRSEEHTSELQSHLNL